MAAPPWIDGGDVCPATARTSLKPCFGRWSADCNLNTADVCVYSLRGTCESGWTEVKRAMFWWACEGIRFRTKVRTAVMAAARPPRLRMSFLKRFHHRSGGGLAG